MRLNTRPTLYSQKPFATQRRATAKRGESEHTNATVPQYRQDTAETAIVVGKSIAAFIIVLAFRYPVSLMGGVAPLVRTNFGCG